MKSRHPGLALLVFSALVFSTACTTVTHTYPELATVRAHRTVAVLPVEMVFTGKAPKDWTAEQILGIEEAESAAFQTSLYGRLMHRVETGHLDVEIQPIEETNRLLADYGLGVRESWSVPAVEIAEILGVDAVASTRIQKTRYLSDLASFGIEVGSHILYEVIHDATDGDVHLPVLYGLLTTNDVHADAMLFSGDDGAILWQVEVQGSTNWTRSANSLIEGITKKLARRFPYRT